MIAALAPMDHVTQLALLLGLGVFAALVGMYVLFVPSAAEQRMEAFVGTYRPTSARSNVRRGSTDFFAEIDRQLRRRQQGGTTRLLLARANASMTVAEFMAVRVVVAVVVGAATALVAIPRVGLPAAALIVIAALLGSFVPSLVLRFVVQRRVSALEAQLPDTLDMIAASLQAGGALTQSFTLIARDVPAPMSEEFQQILREIEVGLSVNEALTNFANRIGSEDVDLVVTTINVQTRVGGNLVQILRTINHTIRERVRIRGEVVVLTAMQRMSAYVIGALPFLLGLAFYLLDPEYIGRLFQPGIGVALLVMSLLMTITGFIVLRNITNIEI